MRPVCLSFVVAVSVLSVLAYGSVCDPAVQTISVKGGQQLTAAFTGVPANCANPSLLATPLNNGGKVTTQGTDLLISEVPNDSDRTSMGGLVLFCDGKQSCRSVLTLDIVKDVPTAAPPTTTAAPPVAVGGCSWKVPVFSTEVGSSTTGTLSHSDLTSKCRLTNFKIDATSLRGSVNLNSKGEIGYYASSAPEQVGLDVLVYCDLKPFCKLNVLFDAYQPRPTQSPPVTQAPPPQPAACPGRYYYNADLSTALSATLNGHTTEPFCAGERTFKRLRATSRGALTNWPDGSFRYQPPSQNDDDSFSFEMKCDGNFVCIGEAFIFSRLVDHSKDTEAPATAGTQAPVQYADSTYQTCKGSCSVDAWANSPKAADANKWDFGLKTSTGRTVGSVDVAWVRGELNINAYGKIGRLSERFPTFEKISAPAGSKFNTSEVLAQAAQSSLPFDAQCLNNQVAVGLGAEVWKGDGLGDRYRKGSSWFQKFGGVHDQCDTFANSCDYAPLLTPKKTQDNTKGTWSVDIDNCDVTWKGKFPYAALLDQKKSDGSRVWKTTADRRLQTTLYSEAVKPARWVDLAAGVQTQTEEYKLSIKLSEWVSIHKTENAAGSDSPFTLDPEFYEYKTANGDRAFGLNMLFYPEAAEGAEGRTNFAADRRVHGFRVLSQNWVTPNDAQCPNCKNNGKTCKVEANQNGDELFTSSNLQAMQCVNGEQPVVTLSKGPSTNSDDCPTDETFGIAKNLVIGRAGFSKPRDCSRTYQNLTLRGVAAGSGKNAQNSALDFEGDLEVQLLLSNGNRATIKVSISLFVSMLSTNGATEDANVELCRSSPYWPVYDPFGQSLPDRRHHLAPSLPLGVEPHLCVDNLDNDFGPQGWAVLGFDINKQEKNSIVRVEQFGLRYPGSNGDVFMVYNDVTTGKAIDVPASVGTFWQKTHPFLNFRDITYRAKNRTITAPTGPVMTNSDFAFALMPGSIDKEVDVDIFCIIAVLNQNGDVVSRPVLRRRIHVDPILTSISRYGPERVADVEDEVAPESPYFFFATSAVIIAVVALAAIAIANDKLPVGKKK